MCSTSHHTACVELLCAAGLLCCWPHSDLTCCSRLRHHGMLLCRWPLRDLTCCSPFRHHTVPLCCWPHRDITCCKPLRHRDILQRHDIAAQRVELATQYRILGVTEPLHSRVQAAGAVLHICQALLRALRPVLQAQPRQNHCHYPSCISSLQKEFQKKCGLCVPWVCFGF